MLSMSEDRIRSALEWRLKGLFTQFDKIAKADAPVDQAKQDWEKICAWVESGKDRRDEFVDALTRALIGKIAGTFEYRLGLVQAKESEVRSYGKENWEQRLNERWTGIEANATVPVLIRMIEDATRWLLKAARQTMPPLQPARPDDVAIRPPSPLVAAESSVPGRTVPVSPETAAPTPPTSAAGLPADQALPDLNPPMKTAEDAVMPADSPAETLQPAPETAPPGEDTADAATAEPGIPPAPMWQYLPIPDDPDRHEEFDSRSGMSPEGMNIIGARVRGKKHKHEGTNCDDWFEFVTSGAWTIITVSDGAGSKKFSRVGAAASCKAAAESLALDLEGFRLKERDAWTVETFRRDPSDGRFDESDLEHVQTALHDAMNMAYRAVESAAEQRKSLPEYRTVLGDRDLDVKDLSGTLLIAVHTTVPYKDTNYSFILACQIGDGIIGAIDRTGKLQLLAIPDSGAYSGETDFLTSKRRLEKSNLVGKTFPYFRPLRALLSMTDGVADDYFPNDPGMLRLFGDLVINRIIEIRPPGETEIQEALEKTKLPTMDEVKKADFHMNLERILANGRPPVRLGSLSRYAELLDLPVPDVAASPALLAAGAVGDPPGEETAPEKRLEVWLDSYTVRGSFDDRALVALYQEEL
jgi:hypothetical protein